MSKNLVSIGGIAASLIVGSLIALAGSQGSVLTGGVPLFALCGIIAFAIQWVCFVPAYIFQTEHYFDLVGSLTYLSLTLLVLAATGAAEPRALLIGAMVILWASRLGTFLFRRISASGEDRRFRAIKTDFLRFLMTWTLQGLWVLLTCAAGLAAMTAAEPQPLDGLAMIGAALWVLGFAIEVVADRQKSAFRANAENRNKFIQHGLWAWSRHPNYFGEITLWLGITIIALPVLDGWTYATLISPFFVIFLLTQVSGVPMLEARAEKQWGDDENYRAYKRATPAVILRPPVQAN